MDKGKQCTEVHIEGRRWFQRSYGNTYHSVRLHIAGEGIIDLGTHYGYDDAYLQIALDALAERGLAAAGEYGSRYVQELGFTYSVADVLRERDL